VSIIKAIDITASKASLLSGTELSTYGTLTKSSLVILALPKPCSNK
jgi:hypothetical protein